MTSKEQALPVAQLQARFAALGRDERTLPMVLDEASARLSQEVTWCLQEEAVCAASPLHRRFVVEKLLQMLREHEELRQSFQALQEAIERLTRRRMASIGRDVNNSVIVLGDGNVIVLAEHGVLARH